MDTTVRAPSATVSRPSRKVEGMEGSITVLVRVVRGGCACAGVCGAGRLLLLKP